MFITTRNYFRDFNQELDFAVMNYNEYLSNFQEDLSFYSTVRQNLLEAEASGVVRIELKFILRITKQILL